MDDLAFSLGCSMPVSDTETAVLAFLNSVGPVWAALLGIGILLAVGVAAFHLARTAKHLPGRKSFDVGGRFDQFYNGTLPPLKSGTISLIYTGYAALWLASQPPDSTLTWLYDPWGNQLAGFAATSGILFLTFFAMRNILKSLWFGLRWLRLEGRGMRWHTADNGEVYRILWLRPDGEFLYDTTIRDHRLQQELTAIRARRQRIAKALLTAAISYAAWLRGPDLVASVYPALSDDVVTFLQQWDALAILAWLLFLFAVIPSTAELLAALADELVYRSGAQFIPGAKVTGARPVPLGRQHVEAQNAHGDADFVSAAEAIRRMTGQPEP
jgi:hypothetical protein